MSNFFKKIREIIASFSESLSQEVKKTNSLYSFEYKSIPRKNVRPVISPEVSRPKRKDQKKQQNFRKRENAVDCDVPTQLIPQSVSKKRNSEKNRKNNNPSQISEK